MPLAAGSLARREGFEPPTDLFCELNPLMERFVPGSGLELVPGGSQFMTLFPRMHLLTSGKIARVGPDRLTFTYTPGDPSWQFVDATNFLNRYEGTSVLIPGRTDQILIIGGQTPLTGTCEIIDFASPDPQCSLATRTNPLGAAPCSRVMG